MRIAYFTMASEFSFEFNAVSVMPFLRSRFMAVLYARFPALSSVFSFVYLLFLEHPFPNYNAISEAMLTQRTTALPVGFSPIRCGFRSTTFFC